MALDRQVSVTPPIQEEQEIAPLEVSVEVHKENEDKDIPADIEKENIRNESKGAEPEVESETKGVEPEIKEVEPEIKEVEPEIKEVEPEIKEVEPEIKEAEPETKKTEPETKGVEPETKGVEPDGKGVEFNAENHSKEEPRVNQEQELDTEINSEGAESDVEKGAGPDEGAELNMSQDNPTYDLFAVTVSEYILVHA